MGVLLLPLYSMLYLIVIFMKLLILSCNTGEGHNSCGKAILHAAEARGIDCTMEDTLALVSERLSKSISKVYVESTKGEAFPFAYHVGGFISDNMLVGKSPVYRSNKLYAAQLLEFIESNHFDAVICVHLFPAEALTALKRKGALKVPTFFVMTDYTCIPFLPETELDHYIIPHYHLIEEYVEKGIPREKITPIGIPVDEAKFTTRVPKIEARTRFLTDLTKDNPAAGNINPEQGAWYLVMSGSMGFGNLGELVGELLENIDEHDHVICVCGRNEETRQSLVEDFGDDARLLPIGYTTQVSLLMDASDVIFTKPGGITSTETIVKGIPMIHTQPIPGLENYNAKFFHYHNLSYHTDDVHQQVVEAIRLATDPAARECMLRAQHENANPNTSNDVLELVAKYVTSK